MSTAPASSARCSTRATPCASAAWNSKWRRPIVANRPCRSTEWPKRWTAATERRHSRGSLAKRTVNRYHHGMASAPLLEREEYIEQVYFFHTFRERLTQNFAAQEVLERLHEEILATTRLPLAIQFLATELKHTGELASGFARLPHYFTPYQAYVVGQAEREGQRFSLPMALLILEREATY